VRVSAWFECEKRGSSYQDDDDASEREQQWALLIALSRATVARVK